MNNNDLKNRYVSYDDMMKKKQDSVWDKQKSIVGKYLSEAGVKNEIVNYITENNLLYISDLESILGKEFYRYGVTQDMIEKLRYNLKNHDSDIRINSDGSIWFSKQKSLKFDKVAKHHSLIPTSGEYDIHKENFYITFENENIIERKATEKKFQSEGKECFDIDLFEKIYDLETRNYTLKKAQYGDYDLDFEFDKIPDKKLLTFIENYEYVKFSDNYQFKDIGEEYRNYNTPLWHFVRNGTSKSQNIMMHNTNMNLLQLNQKLKLIKKSIFTKISSLNKSNLYNKIRQECLNLYQTGDVEQVIHASYSFNNDVCTYMLEKITEDNREIISQMTFTDTEQFRKELLEPALADYARANSIVGSGLNQNFKGQNFYRVFSTTNNVITIDNIKPNYANYIDTEIRKIEPVIYNKQMEQNELQRQNQEGYGYQKVNTRSSGFLDIILLSSIVGFVIGFVLSVICFVFKYNLIN